MIQSDFNTVGELLALAESQHVPVHEVVLAREMHDRERSRGEVLQEMLKNWQVMQESIVRGIQNTERSLSGMTGGDAKKLYAHRTSGSTLSWAALSHVRRPVRAASCRRRSTRRKSSAVSLTATSCWRC